MTIIMLLILVASLSFCLYISITKNLELLEKLEEVTTQTEESLDLLDKCYRNIYEKSKLDIFVDEPIVKDLIKDINNTKDAVLLIANKLYGASEEKPPTSDDDEQ